MKKIILSILLGVTLSFGYKMVFELTPGSSKIHIPYEIKTNGHCDQMIERKAYVSCYNYANKIPEAVFYRLTKESVSPSLKRPHRFFYDNTIPSKYRSKLSHYKRSGYDRGHMMPNAAADYDKQAQMETFILSNIVPQNSKLNRNAWAYLERAARIAAKRYGKVYIITGAVPSKDNFLKKGHVNVPAYMYKIIHIPSINKTTIVFVPNDSSVKKDRILKDYNISFDELKKYTGMDFSAIKDYK